MQTNLPESLTLLALNQKGENPHIYQAHFLYTMAGAVLIELFLAKQLVFEDTTQKIVCQSDKQALTDEILSEALRLCTIPNNTAYWVVGRKNGIAQSPSEWIKIIAQVPKLQRKYYQRLIEKNLINEEKKRALLLFTYKRYPLQSTEPRDKIIEKLQQIINAEATPTLRELILLSLLKAAKLTQSVFLLKKMKEVNELENKIKVILQQKHEYTNIDKEISLFLEDDLEKHLTFIETLIEVVEMISDVSSALGDASGADGDGGGDGGGD